MIDALRSPWPWYVAGPLIGLIVPALLLVGGRSFGISSNLRTICAIVAPRRIAFFDFDWRHQGGWNLAFALGIVAGGAIAGFLLPSPEGVQLSAATVTDLTALGITDFSGLAPTQLFSWAALGSPAGWIILVLGGLLVGFGTAWAGGCTSGHAIMGLADFQMPSLVAVLGFFAGGLLATHVLLPMVIGLLGGGA